MIQQSVAKGLAKFPCGELYRNIFKIALQSSSPQLPA